MDHFKTQFQNEGCKHELEYCEFKQISEQQNERLIEKNLEAKVKKVIWECDSSKSPNPDRVNIGFVKDFWEYLKADFVNLIRKFHVNGKLARGNDSLFIVLIPKNENPQ